MAFDVEGARKAGYTDAEIAQYLAGQSSFDLKGAKSSGYSDGEVIAHLAPKMKAGGQTSEALLAQVGAIDDPSQRQAPPEPSLVDKAIGTGEAALTTITGMTGGTIGGNVGTIGGLVDAFLAGKFGTVQGANDVEAAAARGAQALTYSPRTPEGQRQAGAVGEFAQNILLPAGMAAQGIPTAPTLSPIARTTAAATLDKAKTVGATAVERVKQVAQRAEATPTPGTMGSVGSAGTDVATMRRQSAESLPVPIKLTKGQAERTFEQQRFEQEMAKDPTLGAPLRERVAEQNAAVPRNFESWIDETGAKAASPIEVGRAVDTALVKDAAKAKAEYRVKYQQAEKAGQMAEPVNLQPLADYLNANRAGRTSAPIMGTIADELKVQGVGDGALADGSLVARDATLSQAEALRKAVNKFVKDTDPNDVRVGTEIKSVIDQITEGKGGELYKEARAARQRYAQLYEDNAIVRDLIATRKGTADRQVALENVFRRTILNGTREDLSKLRRTLQLPGSEEGMQAWRELQGQTLRHIIDESTKGVATDVRGNPIVSAAKMNDVIRQLDQGGKLDFVLSKKGAQQVRDMNELVKVIYTAPPGAVNTSNTASVILAAIAEAGATGAISGLPVPVISSVRMLARYVKDRQARQRILQALGEAEDNARPMPPQQNATLH